MRILRLSYHIKGFVSLGDYAPRLACMITEKARFKAKALSFWEKRGLEATLDAFPVKRLHALFMEAKIKKGERKA